MTELFTHEDRERLRTALITTAQHDGDICAAAHTGSYARGCIDRWSDIDIALSVRADSALSDVVARWTATMYGQHGAVAHNDVYRDGTLFRVFILADTLQVDIAFWRAESFGATGPAFQIIFGSGKSALAATAGQSHDDLIGMAWLYALHVRSSVNRGRFLQADYMLNGMRDQLGMLMTARRGLRADHGRGLDDLPAPLQRALRSTRPEHLDAPLCRVALQRLLALLSAELPAGSSEGKGRLVACLALLGKTTGSGFGIQSVRRAAPRAGRKCTREKSR